jgi:hypothetical protein
MRSAERGTRNSGDRLRALNLPERVNVELDGNGQPRMLLRSRGQAIDIETILEEWRVDDEWWRQQIARRYFEMVLASGKRIVLFNDMTTGEWWIQNPA